MDVEIYSKTNCIFCDKAKIRLASENPKIHMLDKDYTREDFFEILENLANALYKFKKSKIAFLEKTTCDKQLVHDLILDSSKHLYFFLIS